MKVIKWSFSFIVLVIVILAVGWFYRAVIIQSSLPFLFNDSLQQAGVKNLKIQLKDIGARQAFISSIVFDINVKTPAQFVKTCKVKFSNIRLRYHWQTIVERKLDAITVSEIQITAIDDRKIKPEKNIQRITQSITQKSENKQAAKKHLILYSQGKNELLNLGEEIANGINIFRGHWREKIPLKSLKIDSLEVRGKIFKGLANHKFSIVFNKTGKGKTQLDVLLKTGNSTRPEKLVIKTDIGNKLSISLNEAKIVALNIELTNEIIHAKYKINLERLLKLIKISGFNPNYTDRALPPDTAGMDRVFIISPIKGTVQIPLSVFSVLRKPEAPGGIMFSLFTLKSRAIRAGDLSLKNVETNILFNFSLASGQQTVSIRPDSFIRYSDLKIANTTSSNANINLQGSLVIKNPDYGNSDWRFNGRLSTKTMHMYRLLADNKTIEIDIKDITANILATARWVKFNGRFESSSMPAQFVYKGLYKLTDNSGKLRVKSNRAINLSVDSVHLSQIISPWQYPVDLVSGKLDISANMSWAATKPFKLSTTLQLDDIGGMYNKLVFSGLTTTQRLDIFPVLQTQKSKAEKRIGNTGLIRLDHLDMGVHISDLHLQLALHGAKKQALPVFKIYNFVGHVFGGRFFSNKFTLDFNKPFNHLKLYIKDIDLTKIAKMQQSSALDISGLLDGELPIEFNAEGIFIRHGYFDNAGRKGYIRYHSKTGTGQIADNSLSNIALKALRDFEYRKLTADLNYVPDGKLSINLHLKGVSPELGKNQAVNLNINMEQNVKALLKSLRYAEGLDKSIDKRVREKYNLN